MEEQITKLDEVVITSKKNRESTAIAKAAI